MSVESPPFATANSTFGAEITRRAITSLLQRGSTIGSITGGIVSSTDCQVSAGTGMTVNVATGEAWIPGTSSSTQGGYYGRVSATDTQTISAADPTNPRIDRICLQVNDKAYSGSVDSLVPLVVTGVPSAGATLSNLVGAGTVPASSLLLANVLVPAGSSSVTNANIQNVATVVSRTQYGGQTAAVVTGLDASKPTASAANAGEVYSATDTGALYLSDGSSLLTLLTSRSPWAVVSSSTTYTASTGQLVFAYGSPQTVNLPSSPAAGNQVAVFAPNATGTNPVTVSGGSNPIWGVGTTATTLTLGTANAAVVLVYDGTHWMVISGQRDSGWVNITPASGVTSTGFGATSRLVGDRVYLRGSLTNGGSAINGGGTIATLTSAHRPSGALDTVCSLASTGSAITLQIASGGAMSLIGVTFNNGYVVDLTGASFTLS